jgi:membrane protease YdiL (CAAX protease family)
MGPGPVRWIRRAVAASLIDRASYDQTRSAQHLLRRRLVVAIAGVIGAVILGVSLSIPPGDPSFYSYTAALAVTWTAGGLLAGRLHLGYTSCGGRLRRPGLTPVVVGILVAVVFLAGALVVREFPPLRDDVESILDHAHRGAVLPITAVTVINGVAEEIFFRGAVYDVVGRIYPVMVSTTIYALVTAATGNPLLVFAAFALGLCLGLQRRASGGILAPIVTHITWSTLMLFGLPPLFSS